MKALKELTGAASLDALIADNQNWVARLAMLQADPQAANLYERMWLIGSPIAALPLIQSEAGRDRRERMDMIYVLSQIRTQTTDKNAALTMLKNDLQQWLAYRAQRFPHAETRRAPPQERTPWPPQPPPCTKYWDGGRWFYYIKHYDLLKPQIQQYEDDILGPVGGEMQGPATGNPVWLARAQPLPPNVRDALLYVGVFKSWTAAFGVERALQYSTEPQPALDQAIGLAMGIGKPSSPFLPGATPIYVLDGANIFNRKDARWDVRNRCAETFANQGGGRPGPVIIVMQHHHFVEDILSTKSGVRTDENLKQLDFFLCQLHGGYFPVVILEMQPEKCENTMWLPYGQSGEFEFPCLYNDRGKAWPKRPDGTTLQEYEAGGNVTVRQKESSCRVWEEEEDKVHKGKKLWHTFCEFDDAIIDQLVLRAKAVHGVQGTFRVSNDQVTAQATTTEQKRRDIWQEMVRLGDRLRVRLYTLEKWNPSALESVR